jgi:hypothetical protein
MAGMMIQVRRRSSIRWLGILASQRLLYTLIGGVKVQVEKFYHRLQQTNDGGIIARLFGLLKGQGQEFDRW